jgi:hypothetical protein
MPNQLLTGGIEVSFPGLLSSPLVRQLLPLYPPSARWDLTKTQKRCLKRSDDSLRRQLPSRAVQRPHAMTPMTQEASSPLPCGLSSSLHLHQSQRANNPTSRLCRFPDSPSPFKQLPHLRAGFFQYVGSTQEYQDAKSKSFYEPFSGLCCRDVIGREHIRCRSATYA